MVLYSHLYLSLLSSHNPPYSTNKRVKALYRLPHAEERPAAVPRWREWARRLSTRCAHHVRAPVFTSVRQIVFAR